MVRIWMVDIIVLLVVVDIASTAIFNTTLSEVDNALTQIDTRRQNNKAKKKKHRSTSSSEQKVPDDSSTDNSLHISVSSSSTSKSSKKKYQPKSSRERRGWRKWHRKCPPCPDMKKKWRDPTIKWICGSYQRARRSFKSSCMMYYRNCQDGTMFVKIHGGRCANESHIQNPYHGDNFFYEYKVKISGDDSSSSQSSTSSLVDESSYED